MPPNVVTRASKRRGAAPNAASPSDQTVDDGLTSWTAEYERASSPSSAISWKAVLVAFLVGAASLAVGTVGWVYLHQSHGVIYEFMPGSVKNDGPQSPLARICRAHAIVMTVMPHVGPQPTLFELLELDPHVRPFSPPDKSAHDRAPWTGDVREAVLAAWSRAAKAPTMAGIHENHEPVLGHDSNNFRGRQLISEQDKKLLEANMMAAVTSALLDHGVRTVYLRHVLPQLEQAKDRRTRKLVEICSPSWKRGEWEHLVDGESR